MRIAQQRFGLGVGSSLAFGWITYGVFLFPLASDVWRKTGAGTDGRELSLLDRPLLRPGNR